jgi:hypothetical protein
MDDGGIGWVLPVCREVLEKTTRGRLETVIRRIGRALELLTVMAKRRTFDRVSVLKMTVSGRQAPLFAILAVVALIAVGCDGDDESDTDTGFADSGIITESSDEAARAAWETLFASVATTPPAEESPTPLVLSDPEVQDLVDSIIASVQRRQAIADGLNEVNPAWGVTAADIVDFVEAACVDSEEGARALESVIPGADLTALPAANEAVSLVPEECEVTNPEFMDALYGGVSAFLVRNQPVGVPDPVDIGEPSLGLQLGYEVACEQGEERLVKWAKRKLRLGGRGGMALSVFVGAALTGCTGWLDELFR